MGGSGQGAGLFTAPSGLSPRQTAVTYTVTRDPPPMFAVFAVEITRDLLEVFSACLPLPSKCR